MILGTFATLVGLVLSPYCPRCKPMDMCFIDAACVHQTDEELMKRGIHGIGGFLLVSKELRIIWSPVYLTRLWCVFEVATYKKLNPEGAVVLAPIFLETVVVLFYASNLLGAFAYLFIRGSGAGSYVAIPAVLLCCLPYLITIHNLRKNYVQKHQLFAQFENFDLDSVDCSTESDRNFVYAAITQLYGSKEAFTSYVKGPLREELLRPIAYSVGPERYALFTVSPIASMFLEFTIALWKGGAPPDVILLFSMSLVLVLCFHFRTAIFLVILLSDHFAEPAFSSICADLLQTFLIFLVFLLHVAIGTALCQRAFFTNQWLLLLGLSILFAVAHFAVIWLHRKSNSRRLTSSA